MIVHIVRGKVVGGTEGMFLIAVNDTWARIYTIDRDTLSGLIPIQSALAHAPSLAESFDGLPEEEEAILAAAKRTEHRLPQIDFGLDLPAVDIVERS